MPKMTSVLPPTSSTASTSSAAPASAAEQQHAILGLDISKNNSTHTLHPQAQWFPRAGLGLFIHWGIASVHGNLDLSWSMMANTPWDASANGSNKVTPREYWKLADRFAPDHFDPEKWIATASRAGFQYAVFTAMHHDGYTLWPSKHSDFGTHTHLHSRDFVGEFVQACRKHNMRIGIYYSPPDWFFDQDYMSFNYQSFSFNIHAQQKNSEQPILDIDHRPCVRPVMPESHIQERRHRLHQRVEELLTRYGHIDLIWFDGGTHDNPLRDRIRQLQPHIVINSRSCDGDYDCTECALPTQKPAGWFETCHCWQLSDIRRPSGEMVDVWGYLKDEQYKSAQWMIQNLVQLRTWGANFLVNVGPRPDGQLPAVVYERFDEVAAWMKHHKDSVVSNT